jgi:hypothetical protein
MNEARIACDRRVWFEAYLDAFNRNDFDAFGAYYAEDVAFYGQAAQLDGRDAVLAFYRQVKSRLDETIELLSFVGVEAHIAAEIRTTLVARDDWPDFPTGPMHIGDTRQSVNLVFYDISGDRFTHIRSARLSPPRRG